MKITNSNEVNYFYLVKNSNGIRVGFFQTLWQKQNTITLKSSENGNLIVKHRDSSQEWRDFLRGGTEKDSMYIQIIKISNTWNGISLEIHLLLSWYSYRRQ